MKLIIIYNWFSIFIISKHCDCILDYNISTDGDGNDIWLRSVISP